MSKNNVANDLEFFFKAESPVSKSTPSGKKRTFKNIVNGHINTEDLGEGRSRSDTYRVRSDNLVEKPNEIVNLTGCAVNLEVLPTWAKGIPCYYKSNNFNQVSGNNNNNTQDSIPDFNVSSSSVHATPSKKPRSDNDTTDINKDICSICYIRYMTKKDVAIDSVWINCKRSCNCWVHARCVGIHYENTEG